MVTEADSAGSRGTRQGGLKTQKDEVWAGCRGDAKEGGRAGQHQQALRPVEGAEYTERQD